MKLKKKDMGKWDKEELSIIIKGYTAKQIADHILKNQQVVDRLHKQIKNIPDCCSKECMGCDFDLLRHIFNKILEGKNYS